MLLHIPSAYPPGTVVVILIPDLLLCIDLAQAPPLSPSLLISTIADTSSKPGSVPTLSRPPSDRKGRRGKEKGHSQDSNGLGTPDLLSGFELEGASNASVNASNRALLGGGAASATASTGQNFFAGFATPSATGVGGAGTVAREGIAGSQAGVMVSGGQGKTGVACKEGDANMCFQMSFRWFCKINDDDGRFNGYIMV